MVGPLKPSPVSRPVYVPASQLFKPENHSMKIEKPHGTNEEGGKDICRKTFLQKHNNITVKKNLKKLKKKIKIQKHKKL